MRRVAYEYNILFIVIITSLLMFANILQKSSKMAPIIVAILNGLTIFIDHFVAYYSLHWLFETTKKDSFLANL